MSNVVVTGSIKGIGPTLLANKRRVARSLPGSTPSLSFASVSVTGTLFPGDAGTTDITNSTTISPPTNGVYKAAVSFSNVPVHDNEWVILQFTGVASDGSKIALGELGGLLNVASGNTTSAALTVATTQNLQVFAGLLALGDISTYDLDKSPGLSATIAADTAALKINADPTTQIYSSGALGEILTALAQKFQRSLTISTSPAVVELLR